MLDIPTFFKKYKVKYETLLSYGFILKDSVYVYRKKIVEDTFEISLFISQDKGISYEVWDLDFNEKCFSINTSKIIESACISVLEDIKKNCFSKEDYYGLQANRLNDYIKNQYKIFPEFLWEKYPDYGVYRNTSNQKWFAMILNIDYSVLDKNKHGFIEVMNLKAKNPESIINNKNIYPAYHMNKKNWISVVLDESLDDKFIITLLDNSFECIEK